MKVSTHIRFSRAVVRARPGEIVNRRCERPYGVHARLNYPQKTLADGSIHSSCLERSIYRNGNERTVRAVLVSGMRTGSFGFTLENAHFAHRGRSYRGKLPASSSTMPFLPLLTPCRPISRSLSTHAYVLTQHRIVVLFLSYLVLEYRVLQFVLQHDNLLLQALRYLHTSRQVVYSRSFVLADRQ